MVGYLKVLAELALLAIKHLNLGVSKIGTFGRRGQEHRVLMDLVCRNTFSIRREGSLDQPPARTAGPRVIITPYFYLI